MIDKQQTKYLDLSAETKLTAIFPKKLKWDEKNVLGPQCLIKLSNGNSNWIWIKIFNQSDQHIISVRTKGENGKMTVLTTEDRKTFGQCKNAKKVARQMAEKAFKMLIME